MNAAEAKRIPLENILAKLGYEAAPRKGARTERWYCSPFREEKSPSFKIDLDRNLWYDFGAGEGGTVVDFALKYFNTHQVSEALQHLAHLDTVPRPPRQQPEPQSEPKNPPRIVLNEVKPLESRALKIYLEKRAIPLDLAQRYLQEAHYSLDGKEFFAAAFKNDVEGYELRNPYFKNSCGRKAVTTLHADRTAAGAVSVFEGFSDFLSALAYYGKAESSSPVIVMNSVSMRHKAVEAIQKLGVGKVHLYLDNDLAGKELVEYFHKALPGLEVVDHSGVYGEFKDFNDFVQAKSSKARHR